MKTILVTGCAGFIGSSFIKSIIKKNIKIIGIDDLSAGYIMSLPKNKNFLIKVKNRKPNDQFGIFSNSKKLFKAINFRPKISLEKYIDSIG